MNVCKDTDTCEGLGYVSIVPPDLSLIYGKEDLSGVSKGPGLNMFFLLC